MPSTLGDRFGQALRQAGYTYDAVAELLGPEAHAALGRNETTPGERRTRGGDPVSTLTRLFLLQLPVSRDAAEVALPGLVEPLAVEGIVAHSVGEVSARLDVRPYAAASAGAVGDLWVVSDLTPGLDGTPNRVDPDHVLGISSASTSLAQLTLRTPVATAVDLGSGCGVLSLHLAAHSRRVIATDVNPRALWLTGFNAELNGLTSIETRAGSLFDPLAGERVDLITSNPPFVISPATGEPLVYRDSGLPGDRVVEEIVRTAPAHLTPGGWCQVLANWAILRHRPWEERVLDWVPPGATPSSCSVRCSIPPVTWSCGSRTPVTTVGATTGSGTTRGWRGWRTSRSKGSGSAGSTCGQAVAPAPPGRRWTGRTRCSNPSHPPWRRGHRRATRSPPHPT